MRIGVHLPQYGRAAGPEAITTIARAAERIGFSDVWVSDHIAVPSSAPYPPPALLGPLASLTWAAQATATIGLGTSILVMPYRHPLEVAKEFGSLDVLSGGRLTVGAGAGFLEGEFDALDVDFSKRGQLLEESLAAVRAAWTSDPSHFNGKYYGFDDVRLLPRPERPIPIWIGGMTRAAIRRAARLGDGWHGLDVAPADATSIASELRALQPDPSFVLSARMSWDGLRSSRDDIDEGLTALAEAGFDHVLMTPAQATIAGWEDSLLALWEAASRFASVTQEGAT